jgi:hypothetical protein
LQREGIVPEGGVQCAAEFQERLVAFEPQTKGQEAIHDAALRSTASTLVLYRPMICLIALLDNPYRGEVGVSPTAFQLVYSHLMEQ